MSASQDYNSEFFAIANDLAAQEANEHLDKQMKVVNEWVAYREAHGQPADLRSLIIQVLQEDNERIPVIVSLCTALWRLREIREGAHGDCR